MVSLATAAMVVAGPVFAQSVHLRIGGTGTLSVNGVKTPVIGVDYAVLEETHRTTFSVRPGDKQSVTFSSGQDLEAGTLSIDAVLTVGGGAIKDEPAQGTCALATSQDGAVVRSLSCAATTKSGAVALEFTGDGAPLSGP